MEFKTVKDLKAALEGLDENLFVATYVNAGEDMDMFTRVRVESLSDENTLSYCKGDHMLYVYPQIGDKIVVIG